MSVRIAIPNAIPATAHNPSATSANRAARRPGRRLGVTERLAFALFRLNEHDADLCLVTPDGLACSDGLAG